jgi:hypothetical protein
MVTKFRERLAVSDANIGFKIARKLFEKPVFCRVCLSIFVYGREILF